MTPPKRNPVNRSRIVIPAMIGDAMIGGRLGFSPTGRSSDVNGEFDRHHVYCLNQFEDLNLHFEIRVFSTHTSFTIPLFLGSSSGCHQSHHARKKCLHFIKSCSLLGRDQSSNGHQIRGFVPESKPPKISPTSFIQTFGKFGFLMILVILP